MLKKQIEEILRLNEKNPFMIVRDDTQLLSCEEILHLIREHGYEMIQYETQEELRYVYEKKIKNSRNRYLMKCKPNEYIPFDIKAMGTEVAIFMIDIFPKYNEDVLKELRYECLDKLYNYSKRKFSESKNKYETIEIILKVCYGIDIDTIYREVELLERLIVYYYTNNKLEDTLSAYLKKEMSKRLINVDCDSLLESRDTFFNFLQEEWERFVKGEVGDNRLNFYAPEIRKYFLSLFKEGYLKSVPIGEAYTQANLMVQEGTTCYDEGFNMKQIELIERKIENILGNEFNHQSVIELGCYYGELQHKLSKQVEEGYSVTQCNESYLRKRINDKMKQWVTTKYDSIHSVSHSSEPIVVHKILDYLEIYRIRNNTKIMLLVMDGMSIENYYLIKEYIEDKTFSYKENGCIAMIPTLTTISRQAIFSGVMPLYFEESLFKTDKEEMAFKRFFEQRDYPANKIAFIGNIKCFEEIDREAIRNKEIVGIVVKTIDEMMHKVTFGKKQMNQDIRLWLEQQTDMKKFIKEMIEEGYEIILTADHGNIEARGIGATRRKSVAIASSGQRAKVFEQFHDAEIEYMIDFKSHALPDKYQYKILESNYASTKRDDIIMTHGGASLEEIIVPFIHIRGEKDAEKNRI
ncbi:MAG: BREX-3 system phosphatase PglZ [Cellulosilyticum sp.]|nr:BREX-3 system phosphatase PglZ [Cellulosilyticum sp.]